MTERRNGDDRLSAGVKGLRGRGQYDHLIERGLLIGGGVALVGGLAAICIGWFGASHTPNVFEQIPYMISGGLLGLGLVFVGGSFYFSYWLNRMVHENRESREEAQRTYRTLNEMVELLAAALREDDEEPATGNGELRVVAASGGTMFHRPECPVVAGRKDVRRVSPTESDLEPCRMCEPVAVST
jgi:hypothetical protein